MTMYLDDIRVPLDKYDYIVRSYDEALEIIKEYGVPQFISFDHDLGVNSDDCILPNGYDLAKWLVDSDLDNTYKLPSDFQYKVHSQNLVEKQNIISLLEGYLKYKSCLSQEILKIFNG